MLTPPPSLTSGEAAARLAADGPNELPTAHPRSAWRQLIDVLREPMLLLLIGAGTINFLIAEPLDGILLMLTVIIVVGISLYQERRAENALAALRDLTSPRALVIRDGGQVRIPGREVVRGDVVLLAEGDRVPADALLVDAVNLSLDESTLTGEAVPVRKVVAHDRGAELGPPGGEDTPWVFSGTVVVRGHGVAVVRATGARTQLGRIGTSLRDLPTGRTRLQREIDRIVRIVAVAGIAAAVCVVVVYGLTRGDWLEGLLAGIATTMSMLPEEFPVILTLFLALGAWRMTRSRVLTRRAPVLETLGSTTVICVDKTGTLTMNRMTVSELIVEGRTHRIDDGPLPDEARELVAFGVLASPVNPFDPMDRAFTELGTRLGGSASHRDAELIREYPLSPTLLALSHVWRVPGQRLLVVAAKGAPEAIAALCHLDADETAHLTAQVERATADGQRVLAVACALWVPAEELPDEPQGFDFTLLGLVGLRDPLRPGVAEAVAECTRAGVRTVMITGDYPGTALAIAREIGMDHATGCITGPELDRLDDAELAERVGSTSVFARMVPEQKLRLVRALQDNGEIVGMTGDGVNDAPALRAADIGIAMGARGTDVAREAAALVITDDDFTSIVAGIRQGRGIFANLRKAMAYVVAIHVVIFGMSLIPVLGPTWPLVLLPLQIAMLELIIDPACSIAFEAEEADPRTMERPPRRVTEGILSRRALTTALLQGAAALAAVLSVFWWALAAERPDDVVRSLAFATLMLANLGLIVVNRSWHLSAWRTFRERRNRVIGWILGGGLVLVAAVIGIPPVREAFRLGELSAIDWAIALSAAFIGVAWFEAYKVLRHR